MTDTQSLKDVPGLGPVSIASLSKRNITTKRMLYTELSPVNLMSITGMKRDKVDEAFTYIRDALEKENLISQKYKTGRELYEEQKLESFITTGASDLDSLFGNGVKAGYLTEFRGENGSGKTQVAIALSLTVLEDEKAMVAYIDTEGKLKIDRLITILVARGMTIDEAFTKVERLIIFSPLNSDQQEAQITNINSMLDDNMNIKLLVIDSIVSLYNSEFMERGVISAKFKLIKPMMRKLKIMAETYKIPVVCINTVYEKPDVMYGKDPIIPAGGNSVGHVLTYRVKLEEVGGGKKHRATMVKSPEYAENQALFQLTDKGVENVTEKPKKIEKDVSND